MRNPLLILLAIMASNSFAQVKKFEHNIGWRGNKIELHTFSDRSKEQVCSVLLKNDSIRGFIMDKDNPYHQLFVIPRQHIQQMRGGFFRNGSIYLFLDNGIEGGIHCWKIDPATGAAEENIIPFDFKKDKIIERISCGDRFLCFTINNKKSELIIHDFTSENKQTITTHKFEKEIWKELTAVSDFSRSLAMEKIDFEGDCSIDIAASRNKLYVRGDTLFLISTAKTGVTKLFSFNLPEQKVDQGIFTHAVASINYTEPTYGYVDNAYLLKDKLYYVWATYDTLGLEVRDLYSGQLLKGYKAGREEEIAFKNTGIVQEGSSWSKGSVRTLDRTRQLVRKMAGGNALVVATLNNKGQVELTVGSYLTVKPSSGGTWSTRTYGPGGASYAVYIPTGGFWRSSWTKSARFKMLLDANTGEHLPGNIDESINERIERYTGGIKMPTEAENLFYCNGNYYYAFYDRDERKLAVVQF